MIQLRGNYSFRVPQKRIQRVHYLTPCAKAYHTVSLYGEGGERRVLLFWKELDDIQKTEGTEVKTVLYEDAVHVGELMDMPVAIVLGKDADADAYDLYYIRNNGKGSTKCP